jgi:hypothetical protein
MQRGLVDLSRSTFFAGAIVCGLACGSVQKPAEMRGQPLDPVDVRVSSPKPVELWSDAATAGAGEAVICRSPCERTLSVDGRDFEVRVPELPDPPRFELPRTDREVLVQVHPAPYELIGAGATLGVLGGGAMIGGGGAAVLDLVGREDFQGALTPGLITVASGAAVLAGGIVCAVLGGTRVTVKELAAAPALRF